MAIATDQRPFTCTGLGTFGIIVQTAGLKTVSGTLTLPNINQGASADSAVVVTVNLNGGSTLYTGGAGATGFETQVSASAGDTINVILTSAAAVDQGLNVVKSTIGCF
jgi:hypothetical protein